MSQDRVVLELGEPDIEYHTNKVTKLLYFSVGPTASEVIEAVFEDVQKSSRSNSLVSVRLMVMNQYVDTFLPEFEP